MPPNALVPYWSAWVATLTCALGQRHDVALEEGIGQMPESTG